MPPVPAWRRRGRPHARRWWRGDGAAQRCPSRRPTPAVSARTAARPPTGAQSGDGVGISLPRRAGRGQRADDARTPIRPARRSCSGTRASASRRLRTGPWPRGQATDATARGGWCQFCLSFSELLVTSHSPVCPDGLTFRRPPGRSASSRGPLTGWDQVGCQRRWWTRSSVYITPETA
jgi:hypothetical protein